MAPKATRQNLMGVWAREVAGWDRDFAKVREEDTSPGFDGPLAEAVTKDARINRAWLLSEAAVHTCRSKAKIEAPGWLIFPKDMPKPERDVIIAFACDEVTPKTREAAAQFYEKGPTFRLALAHAIEEIKRLWLNRWTVTREAFEFIGNPWEQKVQSLMSQGPASTIYHFILKGEYERLLFRRLFDLARELAKDSPDKGLFFPDEIVHSSPKASERTGPSASAARSPASSAGAGPSVAGAARFTSTRNSAPSKAGSVTTRGSTSPEQYYTADSRSPPGPRNPTSRQASAIPLQPSRDKHRGEAGSKARPSHSSSMNLASLKSQLPRLQDHADSAPLPHATSAFYPPAPLAPQHSHSSISGPESVRLERSAGPRRGRAKPKSGLTKSKRPELTRSETPPQSDKRWSPRCILSKQDSTGCNDPDGSCRMHNPANDPNYPKNVRANESSGEGDRSSRACSRTRSTLALPENLIFPKPSNLA